MDTFKDKIAIVTGAASGIGRALALALAERGATVIAADKNEAGAGETARLCGGRSEARLLDVTAAADVLSLVSETAEKFGRLDYVFNNAGIAVGGEARDLSLEHWRRTIDVNLWGVIHGCHAAYRIMAAQGFGHIVNTASLAGIIPTPGEVPYTTTKFAVVGLSRSLRSEGRALGVKVSVVCPGFVATGIFKAATLVNMDVTEVMKNLPFKMPEPGPVARDILAGVAKNKEVIVVTGHGKAFLALFRHGPPGLFSLLQDKMIADMRKIRRVPIGKERP